MKILFICSGNKSNKKPGVIVQNQADTLIKKGVEIDFYLITKKGFFGYLRAIKPLIRKLKKEKYQAIHAHYSLSGYVAGIACLFSSYEQSLIVSLMGSDTKGKVLKRTFLQVFARFLWRHTIVKSESMAKYLQIKNLSVIPNGINLEEIKPLSQFEKRNNTVLFPADPKRISKNFPLAQQSFDHLANPFVNLKVTFNQPHNDIIDDLKSCACVLMTSRWEGSPNVIKEAMACNTPIVTTRVGDVEYLLKDLKGCFIAEDNPKSISDAIQKALLYTENHSNTKGREKLEKLKLGSDEIAEKIIKLYE